MEPRPGAAGADEVTAGAAIHVAPATDRQMLAVAVLGAWIVGGINLAVAADTRGLLENDVWTPWHVPIYLGIGAVVIYLLRLARVAVSQRHPRGLVPAEFKGTVLGAAMLVLYLPLDVAWSALFGTPEDFERVTAVPRLWLAAGVVGLASGPIIAGLRRATRQPSRTASIALVIAIGAVGAMIAFTSGPFSSVLLQAGLQEPVTVIPGTEPRIELHRLTIDGESNTILARGYELREPSQSHDGTRIATIEWRTPPGGSRPEADIHVMRADGTGRREVTNDGAWKGQIAWSPDGTHLAYMASAFGAPGGSSSESFGPLQAPAPAAIRVRSSTAVRAATGTSWCSTSKRGRRRRWSPDPVRRAGRPGPRTGRASPSTRPAPARSTSG